MKADLEEFNRLLDSIFDFTRISNINQSIPRLFENGEMLYISEIYMLHLIGGKDRTTVTELASGTHRTLSAASQIVSRLHRKGIVQKTLCEADKKITYLTLTAKGRDMLNEHIASDQAYYATFYPVVQDYSQEDLQKIKRLIEALSQRSLEAISSKSQARSAYLRRNKANPPRD